MMKKIPVWKWFVPPAGTTAVFLLLSIPAKQQVADYLFGPLGFLIFMLIMIITFVSAVVFKESHIQHMPVEDKDRQGIQKTLYQIFTIGWSAYCIISCGYIVVMKL